MSNSVPWFRRVKPDGSPAACAFFGVKGEFVVLDDGWAASFRDGKWHPNLLFSHEQMAEFWPVQSKDEVERLLKEAREQTAST